MMGTNRTNPSYIRGWRKDYENVRDSFMRGHITLLEAIECFRHLGFKDDALKAEWITLEREKNQASNVA